MQFADVAEALARDLDFLDQFGRQLGEVDVHHDAVFPLLLQQAGDDAGTKGLGRLPVGHHVVVEALQRLRQGNRAYAKGHALQRARHRAGIGNILADIVPAIDARQHQVWLFRHQVVDGQDDAVRWGAGHRIASVA